MKRKTIYIVYTILLLFFVTGCSSSKKTGKQSFLGRAYNDITARDNGYFNSRLLMISNEEQLRNEQVDDYTIILPVFKYGTDQSIQAISPSMDEIIKQSSIVIQLHKKSKWVDDNYFLIGKAHFYKKEYADALTTFQYIISQYAEQGKKHKKGKKKKSTNGEMSFFDKLKQQPRNNEAAIWIVRTLVEQKNYADAQTALSVIKSQKDFPENLKGELYAVEADLFLDEGDEKGAVAPLTLAIENTKDKELLRRYHYILSQLYSAINADEKSIEELKKVISLKPAYEMDFYARLTLAKQMMDTYGVASGGTVNQLKDLLKEDKYKEFFGQIYYTLAGIELAGGNKSEGIDYLNLAIRNGDADALQKSLSYLKLGDIYYEEPDYAKAYAYFDSSLIALPKNNERYTEVVSKRDGLNDLVKELKIIETEKRLQYLASLNDIDLNKELDKMVKESEEEQEFLNSTPTTELITQPGTGTEFYFYNTSLLSRGFGEFKKVWGTRKLEDNWRRQDKSSFSPLDTTQNEAKGTNEKEIDLTSSSLTREDILNSLPKTPEKLAASNARIAQALYNTGSIYKISFNNTKKAKENFTENINTYPGNAYELQSLYQMYLMTENLPAQDEYKTKILTKYPSSTFAQMLNDPDFVNKQNQKNAEAENYYALTYELYKSDSIDEVIKRIYASDSLFKTNPLKPKFEMLNALVLAKENKAVEFTAALQQIVTKYPTDDVAIKAREILKSMGIGDMKGETKKEAPPASYTFTKDEEHYIINILKATGKESAALKNNTSNFNTTNYSLQNLKVSSLLLGKDRTLILIKSFSNSDEAMGYYNQISKDTTVNKNLNPDNSTWFVISKSNYIQFYKSKDVEAYDVFFQDNYLKGDE